MDYEIEGYRYLTKRQKEWLDVEFETPKGGKIKVLGIEANCSGTYCFVECSICSKDKELFKNPIRMRTAKLAKKKVPCECYPFIKWNEEQTRVIVKRICDEEGYIFHGWASDYKGTSTYLDLENPKTGNRWKTTDIMKLKRGGRDPKQGLLDMAAKSRMSYEDCVKLFKSKRDFPEGTIFKRDPDNKDNWKISCPICKEDEYCLAGLCSGVFKTTTQGLRTGKIPCRCSDKFKLSKQQREYQITKSCKEKGDTFLGWCDDACNSLSKIRTKCKNGHISEAHFHSFLRRTNCKRCYDEYSICKGYYKELEEDQDTLYVLDFDSNYLKVGRSFDLKRRLRELKISSGVENIKVLRLFNDTHKNIFEMEKLIHLTLKSLGLEHKDSLWSTETFTLKALEEINTFINREEKCSK